MASVQTPSAVLAQFTALPAPATPPSWQTSLLGPVASTLVLHALLLAAYVTAFHGDLSALVCADRDRIGRFPYEAVQVGFGAHGFDGQFYYAIARNPWIAQAAFLDLPAYRHVRVLLPGLAWMATAGDARALLWAFPAINLLAMTGLAWVGAAIARHYRMNPWWGFVLPLVLNVGTPALRDLTDPLATFAVCGLLAAWLMRCKAWALALWGVLAVLSREQNVAVVGLVLLMAARAGRYRAAAALAVPLALWSAWAVVLHWTYGAWPLVEGFASYPFNGMIWRWSHLAGRGGPATAGVHAAFMLYLTLQIVIALCLACRGGDGITRAVMLAGVALAVLAGPAVYEDGWSYTRVFVWIPLGVWLFAMRRRRIWPVLALAPAVLCPLLAVVQVWRG